MKQDLTCLKASINLGTKIYHIQWKSLKVPNKPSVLTKESDYHLFTELRKSIVIKGMLKTYYLKEADKSVW